MVARGARRACRRISLASAPRRAAAAPAPTRSLAPTAAFAAATRALYGLRRTAGRGPQRPAPADAALRPPSAARAALRLHRRPAVGRGQEPRARSTAPRRGSPAVPVLAAGPTDGPDGARIALPPRPRRSDASAPTRSRAGSPNAPIFVSVARYEPFGLSVLEAAQAGCALVLSDIPTFRELWDGAAAVRARRRRPRARRRDRARRARPRPPRPPRRRGASAGRRYTAEAMAAGTAAVYRALLRRTAAASPAETAAA